MDVYFLETALAVTYILHTVAWICGAKCLPDVYIFGLRCSYHGTGKQDLIGQEWEWRRPREGREGKRFFSLSALLDTRPAGPTNPLTHPGLSLSSLLQVFLWWEHWQGRIIGNFNPLKAIIPNKTFQIYSKECPVPCF